MQVSAAAALASESESADSSPRRGDERATAPTGGVRRPGGGRDAVSAIGKEPEQCYNVALGFDPTHGGSLIGRSTQLWRRHKPRDALKQLNQPSLSHSPLAQINRGVILHDLGEEPLQVSQLGSN